MKAMRTVIIRMYLLKFRCGSQNVTPFSVHVCTIADCVARHLSGVFAYGGGRRGAGYRCSGADPPPSTRLSSVAETGLTVTVTESIQRLEEKLWEWTAVLSRYTE